MSGKRMTNFMAGLLFVGIFCLNSGGVFGSLSYNDADLASEMVFIDPAVRKAEMIVSQLPKGVEVVRLSPGIDGVAQISAHLAGKVNLSAIRIISHGNGGHFVLNGKRIDGNFLRDHGNRIRLWGQSLTENGDILLYACKLAASYEGKVFINKFAHLTNADIAASTDVTGGEVFNGNWNLEYSIGQIDRAAITVDPNIDIKLGTSTWTAEYSTSTWDNSVNWDPGVPGDGDDIIIPHTEAEIYPIFTGSESADVYASLTISDVNATLTVSTGTLSVSGTSDINGTLKISGGTFDASGVFDATSGAVTFTGAGNLKLASTVTSLGTFTKGTGTVTYDGDNQTVAAVDYNVIAFGGTGTKTAASSLTATTLSAPAGTYSVALNGGCAITDSCTFLNTGTTTIGNDAGDSSTFTNGLNATAGPVSIAGTITVSNGDKEMRLGTTTVSDDSTLDPPPSEEVGTTLIYLEAVTINDAKTLMAGDGNNTTISFGSTINSASGGTGNLTINNSATFSNHVGGTAAIGTLTLTAGNVTAGMNITAGTIAVNGGTFGEPESPSGTWDWDVDNVIIASEATMNATTATGTFNVSGTWINFGAFNHKNSTVTLDGSNQTLSGSTTFYNLTKNVTSAATLTFQSGTTTTVENALNLSGANGQLLSLRSSTPGTQWEIAPEGTRTIAYLDVKDSNNVSETEINAVGTNSVSSGNNTNWTFAAPTITSFSPKSGGTNTSVTITGTDFTGATAVTFGGSDASRFTINSSTKITAIVASGSTGKVTVTTPEGTATSTSNFTFYSSPSTTSFSPAAGGTGTSVTITGTNFTGATAVNFGGTAASSFAVNSSTQITAIVASGSTGKVTVTTPGGTATSTSDFTYTAVTVGSYYVNIASGNDANNGSANHPWKTLHHAISQINGGGAGTYVLHVALGTYSIANGESDTLMVLSQSSVTIIGEKGSAPIIDGTNAQTWTKGLEITGSDVIIENLYITGFSDTDEEGIRISGGTDNEIRYCSVYGNNWGIRVNEGSENTIRNCDIYDNSTHGIDIIFSTGTTVVNNKIHDNPLYGIRIECSPEISRNLIYDNTYGILVEALNEGSSSPTIKNNVIYETVSNAMSYGILTRSNNYSVTNPKIYHNTIDGGKLDGIKMEKDDASSSAPIIKYNIITGFGRYGINNSGAGPTINYNDVWNNTADNYNGCTAGANDISFDPKYGSYSLQSDSPCINTIPAGEEDPVTLDYPGYKRPRPGKTTKDMGAYEYVADVTNNYTLPGGTGVSTDYRIFTVPLNLGTGADMLTAMENVLGSYDPTHWRGFLYTGTIYGEFNSSQFASHAIVPGMGFWIITTYTDDIPFEAKPAPDGVDYVMDMEPGWRLIGLPWVSTQITLSRIKVTDGVNTYAVTSANNNLTQKIMWDFTGEDTPYNGYRRRSAAGFRLQNNTGYFFKVLSDTPIRMMIPYADNKALSAPADIVTNQTNTNEDDEAPPPPPGAAPSPDIKANGQDGPVSVTAGDSVSVSISLDPGAWSGQNADWWVAAHTPFDPPLDWHTYVYPEGWRYGIHVCVQTPLYELTPSFNVLDTVLPVGNYIFYFAVDGNMDGKTDATWLDFVEVNVE